jgi:hypothetical protein
MGLLVVEPLVLRLVGYAGELGSLLLLQIRSRNRLAGEWGFVLAADLEGCLTGSVAALLFRGSVVLVQGRWVRVFVYFGFSWGRERLGCRELLPHMLVGDLVGLKKLSLLEFPHFSS